MIGRFKTVALVGALALLLAVVSGCGGGDNNKTTSTSPTATQPSGGGETLKLTADASGALKFNTRHLSAKPGRVTIELSNPSSVQHAISILGNGVAETGATVGAGGVSKVTANLPAGRYDFYCPVDAHKQAGMSGLLVVK